MSAFTFPNIQWSTPVTVTADSPVLNIFQPVSETPFSDTLRNPVDRIVICNQIVFDIRHLDEPGFSRIVDQRCITSPAMWITVFKLRSVEEKSAAFQILQYFRIGLLYKQSGKRSRLSHISFFINKLYKRKIIFPAYLCIVLTKCRSNMNHSGTVCQSNIGIACHKESFLVLL